VVGSPYIDLAIADEWDVTDVTVRTGGGVVLCNGQQCLPNSWKTSNILHDLSLQA
jgi:hypothetical protein